MFFFLLAGIGYTTAMGLATRGAKVILGCRNAEKAEKARAKIVQETGNQDVIVRIVDFASLKSVRNFAEEIIRTEDRLDVLVNNAGIGDSGATVSEDGLLLQMQANYFGPVLLTHLLLGKTSKISTVKII